MEAHAQIGRDVGIRKLLVGQLDVQTHGLGADIKGPAVGCLHDARATTGKYYQVGSVPALVRPGNQLPELTSHIVVTALFENPPGDAHAPRALLITRMRRTGGAPGLEFTPCGGRLRDAGTAEHHDGLRDAMLPEQHLGLGIVHLQTQTPHLFQVEEIGILVGLAVAGALHDRLQLGRHPAVVLHRLGTLPREGLATRLRRR